MNYKLNISYILLVIVFITSPVVMYAQVTLDADGPGNTYELINSALAPGYTAEETPDQCTSHPAFGRHIAEVWDSVLNKYVFEFYIHVPTTFPVTASTADNDRCINFDRQRVEIKTYESSPANLKGTTGETITYKWRFRLAAGFKPSPNFTHIHQIKAVGGDEADPIFTLTVRAGTPNILQLLYVFDSSTAANTLSTANLSLLLGTWVEATEVVKVGINGTYSIIVKKVSDGTTLLTYSNSNIATIRPTNTFVRPKWGIYRSLNSPSYLRNDTIRFAGFSIYEGLPPIAPSNFTALAISTNQINLSWKDNSSDETAFKIERSLNGINGWSEITSTNTNAISYSNIGLASSTIYFYRLYAQNPAGNSAYTSVVNDTTFSILPVQITSFTALLNNKSVNLNWQITNEINLKQYEVELSTDGINFNRISIISAVGCNPYNFQHLKPSNGKNYYRLKMMNTNGTYQYSSVQMVSINNISLNVYPNPAKGIITINTNSYDVNQSFIVMNSAGQTIQKAQLITSSTKFNASQLSSGIYNVLLVENNQILSNYPFLILN